MTNMSSRRLEKIIAALDNEKGLTKNNSEDIRRFFKHMDALGRSPNTQIKVWDRLKLLVQAIPDKDFRGFTREDFETILSKLRKEEYSEWSISTALKVYRAFWRWLYGLDKRDRPPKAVDWFEVNTPPTKLTKEDLLSHEEIEKMIGTTCDLMQKALIVTLCSGPRPGEVLGMKLGDVVDEKQFIKIYAREGKMGKKLGQRPVYVMENAEILRAWINTHPQRKNKNAALFMTKNGPLRHGNLHKIIKRTAERAKINKKVYAYIFRHGYGTMVYSKYGASHGKRLMGHKTLKQESVYVHLDESDLENRLLGRDKTEESPKEEELEMEQKREVFAQALENTLERREDLKKELLEEMRRIIQAELRTMV